MFQLIGHLIDQYKVYGLVQPVFQHSKNKNFYYQLVNNGLIETFELYSEDMSITEKDILPCGEKKEFSIGSQPAYILLTLEEKSYGGNINDLRKKLESVIYDETYDFYTRIEIGAELKYWGTVTDLFNKRVEEKTTSLGDETWTSVFERNISMNFKPTTSVFLEDEGMFLKTLLERAGQYKVDLKRLLVFEGKYAISEEYYTNLTYTIFEALDDEGLEIMKWNINYVSLSLLDDFFRKDRDLWNAFEEWINNDKSGAGFVRRLADRIRQHIPKWRNDIEPFAIMHEEEHSKRPNANYTQAEIDELNEMSGLVMKRELY